MFKTYTYCYEGDAKDFARVKRTRWQPWEFLLRGEWSQSPWHSGDICLLVAHGCSDRRFALKSVGFPTRIVVVAEADRAIDLESAAGAMMRQLRSDGGTYVDGYHDWSDRIDIDRLRSVYRGEVPISDWEGARSRGKA
jgi:hypothetical protein